MMTQIRIPTTQGIEKTLKHIPHNVQYGFYRIYIKEEEPIKFFTYSKTKIYTHYEVNFLRNNKYKFELIQDNKPNCYIYEESISGKHIFKNWYDKLLEIRAIYPKNKLLKNLLSMLWGQLCKNNTININEDDIDLTKYDCDDIVNYIKKNNNNYFVVKKDSDKPYKNEIARMKPFLTAKCRSNMRRLALNMPDNVIRIQTDNVTFDKPFNKEVKRLIQEDKTTGIIIWKNVNKYEKQ
jgi:hypothetical protein